MTKTKEGLSCYECFHPLKDHFVDGCGQCRCELSAYDYDASKAVKDREAIIAKLHAIHHRLTDMNDRIEQMISRVDTLSTNQLEDELSSYVVVC